MTMKSILPSRFELAVFVAMAVVAAELVVVSPQRDTSLFLATLPIFFVASMLGFRRSLAAVPVTDELKEQDAQDLS